MDDYKLMSILIVSLIFLSFVFGAWYFSFDQVHERYSVRYSKTDCLESIHCPREFKESYAGRQTITKQDLIRAVEENSYGN